VNRRQRVAIVAGGAALAIAALVAGALAWPSGHGSHRAGRSAEAHATTPTTTLRRTTTTRRRVTFTTAPPIPIPATAHGRAPPPVTSIGAPATTAAPGPPWPPGTLSDVKYLHGSIVFTPSEFVSGSAFSYTATLTNVTDHWLYIPLEDVSWRGFWIYLHSEYTDEEYDIPSGLPGVDSTAPEFQHETPAGPRNGLLLPPDGSYRFARSFAAGRPDPNITEDTVMHADIQFVEPGVPDPRLSKIARDAGSYTVLVPTTTTTTTTDPSA